MAIIPLPRYAPDKARFNTDALSTVNNVVPASDGWKPLRQIVPTPAIYDYICDEAGNRITDESGNRLITAVGGGGFAGTVLLPAACTGLFAARKKDGTEILFAGTETGLYKFRVDQFIWEDVSSTTYASACRWSFVQFGTVVYAQNGFNAEQKFDVETDTDFSANSSAPICKYLAVVGNFLFRGNIVSWSSQSVTNQPSMIQCSAIEDPTDNEPQNFNFSDFQALPTGDEVMGIVPVSGGAHIWLKNALYGLTITLSDYTFTTAPITQMRGTSSPYSIGVIGQDDYIVYCDDGFWRFNGGFLPIGSGEVNDTFLTVCDQDERDDIVACVDPENLVCWVAYTDTDGDRMMLGFQYVLGAFTQSDIALLASTRSRTFAYGSTITTENLLRFTIIDENGQLGYLVGDNAAASFGTNEVLHNKDRSFVNGLRLVTDASSYSVIVTTRDVLGGSTRARSSATPSARSGLVPVRADGRTHKYDFTLPAGTSWTTATVVDIDVNASGRS
jgi:hypothetical protein